MKQVSFIFGRNFVLASLLAVPLVLAPAMTLQAQGLQTEGAVDAIVGGDIRTDEASVQANAARVLAALDSTAENADDVRRRFKIDSVDIVFLPEIKQRNQQIGAKVAENEPQIVELQKAIEGSAIFYHAINSQRVLPRDIVAMEFDASKDNATIFVAAKQPAAAVGN
ncbi:hypothetical protein QBK99_17935 [Corticibacterium sp. UT-5YL-CI-8]|nr:hypothetical protein [Tianweitania sp. UT-5YL-CI-8]